MLYFDFRVVPSYKLSRVLEDVKGIARRYAAKIAVEVVGSTESKPTTQNAEIILLLQRSIKKCSIPMQGWSA